LLDEYRACAGEEAQRANLVERAHVQARRALSHLEALRSMQTSGEPEGESIALDRLIATLAADVNALANADGVVVRAECEGTVLVDADPSYVRTILENLLDNSLHSLQAGSRTGGTVTILLSTDTSAKRAIVSVADDGPALEPNVRATLFVPLCTTKSLGLGLGLPIARALARAMRGELSLENGAKKAFRLELPLGNGS
jgi:signal transduction histidine kinase